MKGLNMKLISQYNIEFLADHVPMKETDTQVFALNESVHNGQLIESWLNVSDWNDDMVLEWLGY